MRRLRLIILRFALPIGLFLIIFGAKLIVSEKFGCDLPYWDQWDGEAISSAADESFPLGALPPTVALLPHREIRGSFTAQGPSAPTGWYAFSDPVEVPSGSYWCWRLTKKGWNLIIVGALFGLAGLVVVGADTRRLEPS